MNILQHLLLWQFLLDIFGTVLWRPLCSFMESVRLFYMGSFLYNPQPKGVRTMAFSSVLPGHKQESLKRGSDCFLLYPSQCIIHTSQEHPAFKRWPWMIESMEWAVKKPCSAVTCQDTLHLCEIRIQSQYVLIRPCISFHATQP